MAVRGDVGLPSTTPDDVSTSAPHRRTARLTAAKVTMPTRKRTKGDVGAAKGSRASSGTREVPNAIGSVVRGRVRKPAAARAGRSSGDTTERALTPVSIPEARKRYTLYIDQDLLDAARVALGGTSEVDTVCRALVAVLRNRQFERELLQGYEAWAHATWFDEIDVGTI